MKPKALVIDDDPNILEVVTDILESLDHDCDLADSLESARERLSGSRYDYVLLDLEIPVRAGKNLPRIQNGQNLLEEIQPSGTPTIIITGHGTKTPDLAVEMMKKGAVDYVTKPFAPVGKTLDSCIREVLDLAPSLHPKSRRQELKPKRSWTQVDLDAAIREYKAQRASTYQDLVIGVQRGLPGATKSARKLFGRNAIAKKLGVKSAAMVSKSPVWRNIAEELHLGRPRKATKIGLQVAIEEKAMEVFASNFDAPIDSDAIRLIRDSMESETAEATIQQLKSGALTEDEVREIVALYQQQQLDLRERKA